MAMPAKLNLGARITAPIYIQQPMLNTPEAEEPRKKVLIVDDDPVTLRALSLRLKALGFSVVTASDGSQALSATRKERPDVMMVDVQFPPDVAHGGGVPWTGFLLTQWLRRFDDARNTPVILISANDRAEYKQKASAVGATAFLQKPIDNETLLTSLDTALYRKTDFAPAPAPAAEAQGQKPDAGKQGPAENPQTPRSPGSSEDGSAQNPAVELGL